MAEYLIEFGAAKDVDFPFLLHALEAKMYKIAELVLYENNSLADSTLLLLPQAHTVPHSHINHEPGRAPGLGDFTTNALGSICKFSDPGIASFVRYFLSLNPCAHVVVCPLLTWQYPNIESQTDKRKLSSLHIAAASNAVETIKILLDEEPSLLRYRDANKQTAYAYMVR